MACQTGTFQSVIGLIGGVGELTMYHSKACGNCTPHRNFALFDI